jgi:hypothetical protein
MTANKKRKAGGWAKEKIGKRIKSRQFLSRVEMASALKTFLETRSEGQSGLVVDTPVREPSILPPKSIGLRRTMGINA